MKIDFFSALSKPGYECLDFDDTSQLSQQQRQEVLPYVRKGLFLLLVAIDHKYSRIPADKRLRHDLYTWAQDNLEHQFPEGGQSLEAIVQLAAESAEYFYAHCSHETKLITAIGTSIMTSTDDDELLYPDERNRLSSFCCNDGHSPPDATPWTAMLTHGLQLNAEYFGSHDPLVGGLMANSYRLFVEACSIEYRMQSGMPFHLTSHTGLHPIDEECAVEAFPRNIRSTSGVSVFYVCPIFRISSTQEVPSKYWISLVPKVSEFISHINDVFSCPKEILSGETWNYLSLRTRTKRQAGRSSRFGSKLWTFRDSFCELLENMQDTTLAVDRAFTSCISADANTSEQSGSSQDDPNAKLAAECWFAFRQNYISWHLQCKRYGLDGLDVERNTYTAEELCAPENKPLHLAYAGAALVLVTSALSYSYYFI
ncbi:hypothetical protein ASPFODRAFT_207633 [Aspergillus luchuensis CBS 106.47]|uniref:Terpene synthase n=1 Tax=Aspergillus luchuensis (strain CBS 106.47) TaxID=1137211 RepID=A0A1M3TG89_ASPLC|nr:hypothetical protein ASPFODRAFT_207633 [Aspergillus luchuensis CBS 106.47]